MGKKNLVSQRKEVGDFFFFFRKETHIRRYLKETKPRSEFGRVSGSIYHKVR